jgi:hypothetical protein
MSPANRMAAEVNARLKIGASIEVTERRSRFICFDL